MKLPVLEKHSDKTYFLLRLFSGLLFACHGAQKLFGVMGGDQAENAMMWAAGIIEFFGGLAIALGALTQPIALLCAAEMVVAYFMAHAPRGLWPIENRGELALLYLFIFLYIASRGAGIWGVDRASSGP